MNFSRLIVPVALLATACGSKHSASYDFSSLTDQDDQVQELRGPHGECSPFMIRDRNERVAKVDALVAQLDGHGPMGHVRPNETEIYSTAFNTRGWLKKYGRVSCREVTFQCELNMAVEQCPRNQVRPVVRKFSVSRLRTGLKRLQDYLDTH